MKNPSRLVCSFLFPCVALSAAAHGETPGAVKLNDLGFDQQTLQPNKDEAQLLAERTQKLQRHQWLGYTTAALVLGTVLTAPEGTKASNAHIGLAAASFSTYAYTAYLSLSAPEISGQEKSGWGMKVHRAMVWVHLPAMALLPFAGISANKSLKNGHEPTGLGRFHHTLGSVAFLSLLTSAVSMTFEF